MQRFFTGVGTSTLAQTLGRGGHSFRPRPRRGRGYGRAVQNPAGIPKTVARIPIVQELAFDGLGNGGSDITNLLARMRGEAIPVQQGPWGKIFADPTKGGVQAFLNWGVCDSTGKLVANGTLPSGNFRFVLNPGFKLCDPPTSVPGSTKAIISKRIQEAIRAASQAGVTAINGGKRPAVRAPIVKATRLSPAAQDAIDAMRADEKKEGVPTSTVFLIGAGLLAVTGVVLIAAGAFK